MAEPYLNPDASNNAQSDEALEQALEKVRREARARALARKKANDEAIAAHEEASRRRPSAAAPKDRRIQPERRAKPRAGASDRRIAIGGSHRESMQSRPILLIALMAAVIAAVGAVSIQLIHATTPALEGFGSAKTRDAAAVTPTVGSPEFNQPVTASLMRTQGWVLPSQIQTIDPALAKIRRAEAKGLPPEVALVPSLDLDVDPEQELAALTASSEGELAEPALPLPPPLPPAFGSNNFGSGFGSASSVSGNEARGFKTGPRLALPPMQAFGSPNTTGQPGSNPSDPNNPYNPDNPFAGGVAAATPGLPSLDNNAATGADTQPAPSMLEEINREQTRQPARTLPAQPPPKQASIPKQAPKPADPIRSAPSLARLQEDRCARLGFFARVSCKDDVKTQYCEGRWNQHPGCTRITSANNF
ncbi:MAG: hypothetical protein AB8C46_02535 [Burkholderiaceae bacterium]